LRNDGDPDVGGFAITLYLENTQKNAKRNNLLTNKKIPKPNYKLSGGPIFIFNLPGGRFVGLPLWHPVSFATTFHHYETMCLVRIRLLRCKLVGKKVYFWLL